MKFYKLFLMALLPVIAFIGCGPVGGGSVPTPLAAAVALTSPADSSVGLPLNSNITATFSEAMNSASINTSTFTLATAPTVGSPIPVSGTVTLVDNIAVFNPSSDLAPNTKYTATITTGAQNSSGTPLESDFTWSFTTGATTNTTSPTVTATNPAASSTGVSINSHITATFSTEMDPSTIHSTSFKLMQGTTAVAGTVTLLNNVAKFSPTANLSTNTTYTATLTTAAKDLSGNALASDNVWSFTTASATAIGPSPVDLGTAAAFAILSKSGVTNVPTSAITGDVGASPITGAAILLTCDEVSGTIFSVDEAGPMPCQVTSPSTLTTNVSDMQIAYADAAGRTNPTQTELGAGQIGGMTITPGLYKWSTDLLVSTNVTLSGGPNDVWIFQVAGNFNLANGIHVTLSGGAQASNVYWQVAGGTGVDLGTTSRMVGTILAAKAIALATGAVVDGRLLAQTAVTLQSSTVTLP